MNTLLVISFILLAAYLVCICKVIGRIPESINHTACAMNFPKRIVWYIAIWGAAMLAAPSFVETVGDEWRWLAFFTLTSAIVYGMFPVREEASDFDAMAGQVAGFTFVLCSQLVVGLSSKWWLLLAWIAAMRLVVRKVSEWKFWCGVLAATTTYIYCLI